VLVSVTAQLAASVAALVAIVVAHVLGLELVALVVDVVEWKVVVVA
jgi:hypothetical protein